MSADNMQENVDALAGAPSEHRNAAQVVYLGLIAHQLERIADAAEVQAGMRDFDNVAYPAQGNRRR